ncbi:MAG: molecular chaperone TorD family protein [Deltaproteobacteria bacterium]|jgi:TorA maturation chaperone TorD|nr:molecular chaperone TorD family protein [Deltaproteobacteria bacterium]
MAAQGTRADQGAARFKADLRTLHPGPTSAAGELLHASGGDATLEALARAARLRTLAQLLDYPTLDAAERALGALRDLTVAGAGMPERLRRGFERIEAELATADLDRLAAEYVRLFGPIGRCALHGTAYGVAGRFCGRPAQLADIAGFYRAFGLEPSDRDAVPEDDLRLQLEFLSVLSIKEAWARDRQLDDALTVTIETQRKFVAEHFAAWLDEWNAELARANADSLYRVAGELVRDAARAECQRLGVVPSVTSRQPVDIEIGGDGFGCLSKAEERP